MRVSVITVCFNSARTIRDTIESVASQTYQDIEYIVVDGASKDETVAVAREYGDTISQLVSERDEGIYDAMNKGISLATGDIVGMINADDFYATPFAIERVVKALADEQFGACFSDLCYVDPNNIDRIVRYWKAGQYSKGAFSKGWCPPHPTFFVRRRVYEELGTFDQRYAIAADFELMMRVMELGAVSSAYIQEVLVKMRLGGTTNRSFANVVRQNREILMALRQHGLPANPFMFIASKIVSRGRQFLVRPTAE
jgi:glycosyltransferase involved in cell wall biosynthesis